MPTPVARSAFARRGPHGRVPLGARAVFLRVMAAGAALPSRHATHSVPFRPASGASLAARVLVPLAAAAPLARAQAVGSTAVVVVRVTTEARPIADAIVRAGQAGAATDAAGEARLRLPGGRQAIVVTKLGFAADTVALSVRPGRDTAVAVALEPEAAELAGVVVSATRGERRVEGEPTRVEVIGEDEIEEVNGENLFDVRQTRRDPILRPTPGPGDAAPPTRGPRSTGACSTRACGGRCAATDAPDSIPIPESKPQCSTGSPTSFAAWASPAWAC